MKVMNKVTWESMRQNRTRTIMTLLGIILSVTLFCTVLTVVASGRDYLIRLSIKGNGDYFFNMVGASQSDYERLSADPGVSELADARRLGFSKEEFPDLGNMAYYAADPKFWEMGNITLSKGRLPENPREVLVFSLLPMIEIGDQVTMVLDDANGEVTCTVVGVGFLGSHCAVYLSGSLLTVAQGGEPESDHHLICGKTFPASHAVNISKQSWDARTVELNEELLSYYGVFLENSAYTTLYIVALLVLLGIVTACSVSLIHNAFSISVSQRMKQYGVLSSVGATGRQIFKSVAFEAWVLYLVGTPVGLLLGYGLAGALIAMIRYHLGTFLKLPLTLLFSPLVLLGASLLSLATVFLSAWIPSVKARRTVAIEAIRQSKDYHVPKRMGRNLHTGVIPAALARKYYRTSGKKYRATVSALAVSMALVILAGFFTDILNTFIAQEAALRNYDLGIYTQDPDMIAQIRALPGVERAALAEQSGTAHSPMWAECISQDYLEHLKQTWQTENIDYGAIDTTVLYLEDTEYEVCLRENGLDPAGFPPGTAFVLDQRKTRTILDSNGDRHTVSVDLTYLKKDVSEFFLVFDDSEKFSALLSYAMGKLGLTEDSIAMPYGTYESRRDGTMIYTVLLPPMDSSAPKTMRFEIRLNKEASAEEYHYLDPDTGKPEETAAYVSTANVKKLSIGGHIQKKPFGYDNTPSDVVFLMPLSAADEDTLDRTQLRVKCSDISLVLSQLSDKDLHMNNIAESEMISRSVVSIVSIVSAVFVGMIIFMASANIFNTLSTNLLLRARDYAMLESVGMGQRDVLKMIGFECATYGLRALLWGLPVSVGLCWLLARVAYIPFRFPWVRILASVLGIAGVVLVSFAYARARLRKGSLMDTIRNENM